MLGRDFLELLTEFNRARVRYLVLGGYAVTFHARPRATKDLDVWVDATPANAKRVLQALASFGAPLHELSVADLERPGQFFVMGVPPFRIDILTEASALTFRRSWPRRVSWRVAPGVRCWVLGRADLLANKRAAGRPQDLADVDAIERTSSGRRRARARPK